MTQVLMIVGSLRKKSLNRQMAYKVEDLMGRWAEVTYLDYADVPPMNQDREHPPPESVVRVREKVREADALWFCTAEYNQNMPGMLKNLMDWLSRSVDPLDRAGETVLSGKVAAIAGCGGKNATAGSRENLRALLEYLNIKVVGGAGVGVALPMECFVTDVAMFSRDDVARLGAQVNAFLDALI